ncbi:unnamed protein product [Blepharisma stoltei]|uniref:Anaphase-promoting complex subunit 4 n=1 Tax=Blepharisma stoltei TaxID=1481888 RepID=A0AAU9IFP8_9CILI|nr:unnamed protein product [Blepharisma stoltei]
MYIADNILNVIIVFSNIFTILNMGDAFQLVYEHVLSSDIRIISGCKNKDLLALITEDDTIIIKRISHKPKNVASIDEIIKITTLAFKEDGNAIAIGGDNGLIKVYYLESKGLVLVSEHSLHSEAIGILNWLDFPRQFSKASYIAERYIPNSSSKSNLNIDGLSLLYSIGSENINLIANGQYPFATFSKRDLSGEQFSLNALSFNENLTRIVGLFTSPAGVFIGTYNSLILNRKSENIYDIAHIFTKCEDSFKILEKSLKDAQKEWQFISNSFLKSWLGGIEEVFNKNGVVESVQEVLFQCAGTGVIPPCLAKFIKDGMQNAKQIQLNEEKLSLQVKNIEILLLQNIYHQLENLAFYISTLASYANCPDTYGPFGLDKSKFQKILNNLNKLLKLTNTTMELISDAHYDIKNTLSWLFNWNIRLNKEEEQADQLEESPVNMKKLLDFLSDSDRIYFKSLRNNLKSGGSAWDEASLISLYQKVRKRWVEAFNYSRSVFPKYIIKQNWIQISNTIPKDFSMRWNEEAIIVATCIRNNASIYSLSNQGNLMMEIPISITAKHISLYTKNKFQIVIVGSAENGSEILEINLEGLVWSPIGSEKKVTPTETQSRIFVNDEVTLSNINQNRGIAAFTFNERLFRIVDLEDSDFA